MTKLPIAAKKKESLFIFIAVTFGIQLFAGLVLTFARDFFLGIIPSSFYDSFFNLCNDLIKVLIMIATFIGFGFAFATSEYFGPTRGAFFILISLGTLFVGFISSAIIYNLDYIFSEAIYNLLGAMINILINISVYAVMYYAIFFVAYFVFIKKIPREGEKIVFFSLQNRRCCAALVASGVSLMYNLIMQARDSHDFIIAYAPIYPKEIVSIVLDFLFVVLMGVLSYVVLYFTSLFMLGGENKLRNK